MAVLSNGLAAIISVLSAYALSYSAASISKLKTYEKKAEKAAEWSNVAKRNLWNTRYTVGVGFLTCLASMLAGALFAFYLRGHPGAILAAVASAALRYASSYMQSFWDKKSKVPFMDDYNKAISVCVNVMGMLDLLAATWAGMVLLRLLYL